MCTITSSRSCRSSWYKTGLVSRWFFQSLHTISSDTHMNNIQCDQLLYIRPFATLYDYINYAPSHQLHRHRYDMVLRQLILWWNHFACNIDVDLIESTISTIVDAGLATCNNVNLDICFSSHCDNAVRVIPDPNLWSSWCTFIVVDPIVWTIQLAVHSINLSTVCNH